MIPRFDVDVRIAEVPTLYGLTVEDATGGWVDNHEYERIVPPTWGEIVTNLETERALIARADAESTTVDEFERKIDELLDEFDEPAFMCDVGVDTLVMALNGVGIVTGTSCRGHPAGRGEDHPLVVFATDREHLNLLVPLVERAGCGVGPAAGGNVIIWATNVVPMMDLTQAVIDASEKFEPLPTLPFIDDEEGQELDWF